ncbi:MAG: hypothetical protein HFJ91_10485 [Muribaculaceae bacterium]|nr:hypothetical protein [Muribaculaceae bacterium]
MVSTYTRHISALLLATLCATTAVAQDLHKEITVEQEIIPTRRDASRIGVLPTVSLPPLAQSSLSYSDKVVTSRVPNSITTLAPVAWGDKLEGADYRGYIDIGAGGPLWDGSASAGYRIVDNDRTRLSIWGQYDGDIYKRGGVTWKDHTTSAGVDLHSAIGSSSMLDAGVDFTYGYHNGPNDDLDYSDYATFSQGALKVDASAVFHSRLEGLGYAAGFKYQRFAFAHPHHRATIMDGIFVPYPGYVPDNGIFDVNPVGQNLYGVILKGIMDTGENSHFGLDIDADFLHSSAYAVPVIPYLSFRDYTLKGAATTGLVKFTPRWAIRTDNISVSLGVALDMAINSGTTFRLAPDVTMAWTPSQIFGLELKAKGGSQLNPLADIYSITPYINGSVAYGKSRIPYSFDARLSFGPFLGTTVELFGGYAKADSWLMGSDSHYRDSHTVMDPVDIKGWHAGISAGYDNGRNFSVKATYETAPGKYNRAYYEWRDRARHVVSAELKLRPVSRMLVELSYSLRSGRSAWGYESNFIDIMGMPYYPPRRVSLRTVSDLTVGVGYSASRSLTLFARGQNLLGRRYYHLGMRPSQSACVMVGAGLKF